MKLQEAKRTNKPSSSLCSVSGLLLSVMCCVALIHVELRIQEHHRLIENSVTSCDQLEKKILQKVQQNYREWQLEKCSHNQGDRGQAKGMLIFPWGWFCQQFNSILPHPDLQKTVVRRREITHSTPCPSSTWEKYLRNKKGPCYSLLK